MRFTSLVTTVLALAASATAQRVLEIEPNDTVPTAQVLVPGNHVSGSLIAAETDWYSFSIPATAVVYVNTSNGVDLVVSMYDSTGTTRHAHNDGSSNASCGVTLPAGSYAVEVRGFAATTAGNYALDLFTMPNSIPSALEGAEPNDTIATATPIVMGNLIGGNLSVPADVDLYSFSVLDRSTVQFDVSDDSTSPQLDDTILGLYVESPPASGTLVLIGTAANVSFSHRATLTPAPAAATLGGVLAAGTYYLRVSTTNPPVGGFPAYNGFGNYTIRSVVMTLPSAPTTPENPEPNNTVATATPLAPGTAAAGNITAADVDYYSVVVTQPTIVTLITIDGPAPAITDTTIRLRDANNVLLLTATSGGFGSHARTIVTVNIAGTYIIDVGGGTTAVTGNYLLLVGPATPNFITAVHSTVTTGGCVGSNALTPNIAAELVDKPVIGSDFVMRVSNLLPNAGFVTMLGFTNLTANGGATPLPFDLGGLGAPGCMIRVDPLFSNFAVADAAGVAFWELPLPSLLALRGLPFFQQIAAFDAAANVLGLTVSNTGSGLIGERYLL